MGSYSWYDGDSAEQLRTAQGGGGGTVTKAAVIATGLSASDIGAATPASVTSAINALVNGAPGALDTLKEIADQLSSDESAASAIAGRLTTAEAGLATLPTTYAALPDMLQAVSVPTALTASKIRPFNAVGGAITNTALPALSGLTFGATYGISKIDVTNNVLSQPFASGDTTFDGATKVDLSLPGTVFVQAVANPAGGGKIWRVVNHVRSDTTILDLASKDKYNLRRWGAIGDGEKILDASITSGVNTVTSATRTFTTGDVGKAIGVALPVGSLPDVWVGTIMSVAGGAAVVDSNAPITQANSECTFGTANDAALARAVATLSAAGGGTILVPEARFVFIGTQKWANNVSLVGVHRETSIVSVIKNGATVGGSTAHPIAWIESPSEYVDNPSFPLTGCTFANIKFEGRMHTNPTYSSAIKVLHIYNVKRVTVTDCWFDRTGATSIPCDQSTDQCTISYNLVTGPGRCQDGTQPGGSGVGMGTAADSTNAEPSLVIGNVIIGLDSRGANGIFTENTIVSGTGAYVGASVGYRISNNFVSGMRWGITDAGSRGTIIANNTLVKNRLAGINLGPGTYSKGLPGRHYNVTNNFVYGTLDPTASGGAIIVDMSTLNDTTASIPANATAAGRICGNVINGNQGPGINFLIPNNAQTTQLSVSNLAVTENHITNNGLSGITSRYAPTTGTPASSTSGLKNCDISRNVIANNGFNAGANGTSPTHACAMRYETHLFDCVVDDNRCYDDQATKTQNYGLFLSTSVVFTGGSFQRNKLRNMKTGTVNIVTAPGWGTGAIVRDNEGFTLGEPTSVTATASPMTYTAGVGEELVYVSGGTVTSVTKGGLQVAGAGNSCTRLAPGEAMIVTYTAAPTIVADKR